MKAIRASEPGDPNPATVAGSQGPKRRRLEVGRRDQHAERLAPDDHARIVLEIEADGDRVALAPLEGTQSAEIDEGGAGKLRGRADRRLGHQVDVIGRPRPDFEVGLEEY